MIIALTGFMGSGKSRIGKLLAESIGWEFIDLDRYIVHKTGRDIPQIFQEGELKFRVIEAEAVRDIITMRQVTGEDLVLALGGGTFSNSSVRWLILEQTQTVFLHAGLDTIIGRLGTGSRSRPLYKDKYSVEQLLDDRTPDYEEAKFTVETGQRPPEDVVEDIKSFIFK